MPGGRASGSTAAARALGGGGKCSTCSMLHLLHLHLLRLHLPRLPAYCAYRTYQVRCLEQPDFSGCTPALLAARAAYRCQGHEAAALFHCVALCLRFGADVHAASLHDGRPLLFFASAAGALDILTTLLGPRRADPNVRCHDGTTPLHFAAAHGQARATACLASELCLVRGCTGRCRARACYRSLLTLLTAHTLRRPLTAPSPPPHQAEALPLPLTRRRPYPYPSPGGGPTPTPHQVEAVRMLLARGSSSEARDAQGRLPVEHALRGLSGQAALGECHAECHALLLQHMAR